jgi:hypothetical protein
LIDHGPLADTDNAQDVYRYDAESGALTRLSTDADGAGGNQPGQNAFFASIDYGGIRSSGLPARGAISDDGRSVVFTTNEALAPGDTNGTVDTYLWHDGHVALISSGKPSLDGEFPPTPDTFLGAGKIQAYVSPSGRDVYFATTAKLVQSDDDTVFDIYDARMDGGFAASAAAAQCTGESCRAQASPPPTASSSATQLAGAGNQPNAKHCPKSKVKQHGRCVKKHHGSKHRQSVKHHQSAKHRHAAKHRSAQDKGVSK